LLDILKDELGRVGKQDGVDYADVRLVEKVYEGLKMKNGKVDYIHQDEDRGFGIRVLFQGAWGFASSSRLEPGEVERIFEMAVQIARSSASVVQGEVSHCHRWKR